MVFHLEFIILGEVGKKDGVALISKRKSIYVKTTLRLNSCAFKVWKCVAKKNRIRFLTGLRRFSYEFCNLTFL